MLFMQVACRRLDGHSANSYVSCLSYSPQLKLLVSGDIRGRLLLWSQASTSVMTLLDTMKLKECGDCNSITFHPSTTYDDVILVGSSISCEDEDDITSKALMFIEIEVRCKQY